MFALMPGGRVVNMELVENTRVENAVLIFLFSDNTQLSITYSDSSSAYAAQVIFYAAAAAESAGPATIVSVSPNSLPAALDATVTIIGTGFTNMNPVLAFGATGFVVTFVSSTTLSVAYVTGFIPAGTYNVTYIDNRGAPDGQSVLVNGITFT